MFLLTNIADFAFGFEFALYPNENGSFPVLNYDRIGQLTPNLDSQITTINDWLQEFFNKSESLIISIYGIWTILSDPKLVLIQNSDWKYPKPILIHPHKETKRNILQTHFSPTSMPSLQQKLDRLPCMSVYAIAYTNRNFNNFSVPNCWSRKNCS